MCLALRTWRAPERMTGDVGVVRVQAPEVGLGRASEVGGARRDLSAEQFDAEEQVVVGQARVSHLQRDAVNAPELVRDAAELGDDLVWVAKEERAVWSAGGVELRPGSAARSHARGRPR